MCKDGSRISEWWSSSSQPVVFLLSHLWSSCARHSGTCQHTFFMLAERFEVQSCHSLGVYGFIFASQWAGYIITITSICLLLYNHIKPILLCDGILLSMSHSGCVLLLMHATGKHCGSTSDGFWNGCDVWFHLQLAPFFTFPHPGRSSTGVTNNINGGFIPLRCASLGAHAAHMLALWHGFLDRLRGSEALLTGVINHVCCGKKSSDEFAAARRSRLWLTC